MSIENGTFVLTEDTSGILQTLQRRLALRPTRDLNANKSYFDKSIRVLERGFLAVSPNIGITPFTEELIENTLKSEIENVLEADPRTICLCFDRFLLDSTEEKFADRFSRLQICRSVNATRVPRQDSKPLKEQITRIGEQWPDIGDRSVLLVDDGIFSGGTVDFVLQLLSAIGVEEKKVQVLGFIGNGAQQDLNKRGITTRVVQQIENLFDWVDLRDFGPFGGKLLKSGRGNRVTSAVPYLFPWSQGEGASLNMSGNLFETSREMIRNFKILFSEFETGVGKRLLFSDLVRAGFPLPTDGKQTIEISLKQPVQDYLSQCLLLIEQEEKRLVVVFDMDGTLYQLDGEKNGYSGSTLENKVLDKALKFIIAREKCSEIEAEKIRSLGLVDQVGLSAYLAQRYNITRREYFDDVWNLDPKEIIQDYEPSVATISRLTNPNVKLVLLTSAPRVWAKRVLEYLGLESRFESFYTGEDFDIKDDVFKMLSQRYSPGNVISVGDQQTTDILPAQAYGLSTLLIQKPTDVSKILEMLDTQS